MRWRTLAAKWRTQLSIVWVGGVAVGAAMAALVHNQAAGIAMACLLGLPVSVWLTFRTRDPIERTIRALQASVAHYSDGHFGHSLIVDCPEELRPLLEVHNELGQVLRAERSNLVQRELMLETIVENSPVSLVLIDNYCRVAYANGTARQLIGDGRTLEGQDFGVLMQALPSAMRQAFTSGEDGIFTMDIGGSEETLLLLKRDFLLQGVSHKLYVIRPVTREMARTEVATWKKVIRVVSHELNNTLAPISSLTFTGAELARAGAIERMAEIFGGIRDRTEHLQRFVQGYASFARLPTPQKEYVEWASFLEGLALHARVRVVGELPSIPGYFDPGQIEQVLINLIKNATESGGAQDAVELEIRTTQNTFNIDVRDRGSGMNDAVLANAFLPFYSTKRIGTGLGLAVAREIVDAHAGRLMLSNRAGGGLTVTVLLPIWRENAFGQSNGK
jgi:two-component system, NtrC family, nitrogen regulation sensor histidine kinase NtrY